MEDIEEVDKEIKEFWDSIPDDVEEITEKRGTWL